MGAAENDVQAQADERPRHKVYLNSFWMDRTEITNSMFAQCAAADCQASLNGKKRPAEQVTKRIHGVKALTVRNQIMTALSATQARQPSTRLAPALMAYWICSAMFGSGPPTGMLLMLTHLPHIKIPAAHLQENTMSCAVELLAVSLTHCASQTAQMENLNMEWMAKSVFAAP